MKPDQVLIVNGKIMAPMPGDSVAITHVGERNRWSREAILAFNDSYYSRWIQRMWSKNEEDACSQKNQSVAALAMLLFKLGIRPKS